MIKKNMSTLFLGMLSVLSLFAFDLYQPSLPTITNYFHSNHETVQLTMNIYLLVFGLGQLLWGPLIDHFGRRMLFFPAMLLAVLSTLLCTFSTSIGMLIFARALQGFANCCPSMISNSSPRDYDDEKMRARLVSYISMIVSISPIFAPIVGAIIIHYANWRFNFLLMFVLSIGLWLLGFRGLHESPHWKAPKGRFSIMNSWRNYAQIIGHRYFWYGVMVVSFAFSTIMITVVNAAYIIIDGLGYAPWQFGLLFAINGVNIIIGNSIGLRLREHYSLIKNCFIGSIVMILGAFCMLVIYESYGFGLLMLSPVLIVSLGVNIIIAPTVSLLLESYSQMAASAVAVMNTVRMVFAAVISAIVAIFVPTYEVIYPVSLLLCGVFSLLFTLCLTKKSEK